LADDQDVHSSWGTGEEDCRAPGTCWKRRDKFTPLDKASAASFKCPGKCSAWSAMLCLAVRKNKLLLRCIARGSSLRPEFMIPTIQLHCLNDSGWSFLTTADSRSHTPLLWVVVLEDSVTDPWHRSALMLSRSISVLSTNSPRQILPANFAGTGSRPSLRMNTWYSFSWAGCFSSPCRGCFPLAGL
jgi:hypothetical protein